MLNWQYKNRVAPPPLSLSCTLLKSLTSLRALALEKKSIRFILSLHLKYKRIFIKNLGYKRCIFDHAIRELFKVGHGGGHHVNHML